jgi:ribosomal protein S18 acetylase RimI-like enzyme
LAVTIRPATSSDASRIAEFNCRLAEESEGKTLDGPTVLAGVGVLLDTPGHGRYFVAENGSEIVGQLLITFEWSDWRNGQFWWLQSVYVVPSYRRQGIFSMLYSHVASLAEQDPSVCGLRLYVDERNERALDAYRSLGLDYAGYRVMERKLD